MNFFYGKLNNLKIKNQLLTTFFLFGLLPFLGLIIFLNFTFYKQLLIYNDTKILSDNRTTRNVLMDVSNLTTNISKLIASSDSVSELTTKDFSNTKDIYQSYLNFISRDTFNNEYVEIADIHLYVSNPTMIPVGRCTLIDAEIMKTAWYKDLINSKQNYAWVYHDSDSGDANLYLMKYIRYSTSSQYAILAIGISNTYLSSMCDDLYNTTYITLDDDRVIFSTRDHLEGETLLIPVKESLKDLSSYKSEYKNKAVLAYEAIYKPNNSENFFKITTISFDKEYIIHMLIVMFSITAIAIMLPLWLFVRFSDFYSSRLLTIRRQMHKIAQGELDMSDEVHGQDELGQLYEDMHTTITGIQTLHDHILNEQLEKDKLKLLQQQTQFELLSSQVNPHFLFNTLETIRMKALINHQTEIDAIIIKLGKILRYSLSHSSSVNKLSTELEYIEAYLEIQHFRFENKINHSIHIQPQLNPEHIYILSLMMQPIVENAIIHGFATKKRAGIIHISILARNNTLKIMISDNGCGIPENKLVELLHSLERLKSTSDSDHIGLKNVHHRIKLQYGDEYGLSISSTEKKGTTVIIEIPYDPLSSATETSIDII